eukprot:4629232-Pyramimonas_sp.AAC.1
MDVLGSQGWVLSWSRSLPPGGQVPCDREAVRQGAGAAVASLAVGGGVGSRALPRERSLHR